MDIAHVTDFYLPRVGGIEQQVAGLAARQAADGHRVDVITATGGVPRGAADVRVLRAPGVPPGQSSWAAPARSVRTAHEAVRSGGYDVVHVHAGVTTPAALAGLVAAVGAQIPTVVTAHSMLTWTRHAFAGMDRITGWTSWPVVWSAVSTICAADLRAALRDRQPVRVLPNSVDPARWPLSSAEHDPTALRLVSVMRLARRKRPLPLLRILRSVRRTVPEHIGLDAVIIGAGPARAGMQRYLSRHDMAGWVALTGCLDQPEIHRRLGRADVFVAPARLESFGIAALEARHAGLPVVALRASGIADFIDHGRDGLLADSDADMVRQLTRLATDTRLRVGVGSYSRAVPPTAGQPDSVSSTYAAYAAAADLVGRSAPVRQAEPASM